MGYALAVLMGFMFGRSEVYREFARGIKEGWNNDNVHILKEHKNS